MDNEKFIWCRSCREAHHVSAYDRAPVYDADFEQEPVDDWRAFMRHHAGHRLEALAGVDQASWQGGNPDPMQQKFLEVTNGRDYFVVRAYRRDIHEALSFEIVPGRLYARHLSLEIQEDAIRKELERHFNWTAARPADEKIELFIGVFRKLVGSLAPETVQVSRSDYREAGVVYGGLSNDFVERLLQECARYFVPEERTDLRRFLAEQQDGPGVMAIRVRCEYAIEKASEISSGSGQV